MIGRYGLIQPIGCSWPGEDRPIGPGCTYGAWGQLLSGPIYDATLNCEGVSRYLWGVARCWALEAAGSPRKNEQVVVPGDNGDIEPGVQLSPDAWEKERVKAEDRKRKGQALAIPLAIGGGLVVVAIAISLTSMGRRK